MLININLESETPIYTQLINQLLIGMAKGTLKEGDTLPSVRQLASDIGVNMHTINKAYNILKSDGFLVIHRRKGVVVNQKANVLANEAITKSLIDKMTPIIAECKCRGIDQPQFNELIGNIFKSLEGE